MRIDVLVRMDLALREMTLVMPGGLHQPEDGEMGSGHCLCSAVDPRLYCPRLPSRDEVSKDDWHFVPEPQEEHSQSTRPYSTPSVIWVVGEAGTHASDPAI